jgi:hypothetical protein
MNKSKGTITVRLSLNVEMRDLHYVYQRLASSPTEVERRHELKQILFEFQYLKQNAEKGSATAEQSQPVNSPAPTHTIDRERKPVIATLEPKKGFVYTGSNMYPKDQLY